MAATGTASFVVEGDYSALLKLDFPLPALVSMQDAGFNLRGACWDMRKSLTGFSVSFFWPDISPSKSVAHLGTTTKNKPKRTRRRTRRKHRVVELCSDTAVVEPCSDSIVIVPHSDSTVFKPCRSNSAVVDVPCSIPAVVEPCSNSAVDEPRSNSAAIMASPDIVAIKPFSVTEPVKSAEQTSLEDVLIDANDDVYYYEHGDTPGICVEHGNGSRSWSPVKFTRREVKTPSSVGLSDDVIDAEKCLCVEYQRRDNIPGFEILTNDDNFWVPVAHRTRSRLKSPPESNVT